MTLLHISAVGHAADSTDSTHLWIATAIILVLAIVLVVMDDDDPDRW